MRLLAATAAALLIGTSAGAVTVINGSFEDGVAPGSYTTLATGDTTSLPGWEVLSVGVDYIGSYWVASAGSRSIDLSAISSGGVKQSISGFTAGATYRITFDLSANPDGASRPKRALVSATGGVSQEYTYANTLNTTSDMMYETFTYDFVASGTLQDIQFRSEENNAYGTVLDNVSIAEVTLETPGVVSESATWGLMLGGFMMVGAAARRRGRTRSIAA